MKIRIVIEAETEDEETVAHAVELLEITLPYMFDNVVVSSEVVENG